MRQDLARSLSALACGEPTDFTGSAHPNKRYVFAHAPSRELAHSSTYYPVVRQLNRPFLHILPILSLFLPPSRATETVTKKRKQANTRIRTSTETKQAATQPHGVRNHTRDHIYVATPTLPF